MGLMGTSRWGRALTTVLVGAVAVAGGLVAVAQPAVADDGDRAAAYYAAVAEATQGRVPTAEQENANTAAGLASTGGVHSYAASDADPSKFLPGKLVSDPVFYNGSAWSQATIQNFLNSKVGTCKATTGPTCLKSYTVKTTAKAADAMCSGYTPDAAAENAARIVSKVAASCGINPVVLLVMVQKEQGLVTSSAPTQRMYDYATGWNCPDTTLGCSTNTASTTGLFNQVYGSAWQFKRYGYGNDFSWYPVRAVTGIWYNTDSSCGKKQVFIENKATAALYYYTPYTPNAASLASYPGEGDSCSAYGIRNFWMLLNTWYGSSTAGGTAVTDRLSGVDRYATSVAISRAAYPTPPSAGVNAAFVANGLSFADALAAAPAAAKLQGPLLLTAPGSLPASVQTELTRLKPATIYVAGGTGAVPDTVLRQLRALNGGAQKVLRVSGIDRYQTAIAIAKTAFPSGTPKAYLAYGLDFPDALSAGAAAGANNVPVLLVKGSVPDATTLAGLNGLGVTSVKIAGGTGVIPGTYPGGLSKAGIGSTRVSGIDRYATSVAISADGFPDPTSTTLIASGMTFPDALAGAAYAGAIDAPLLVARTTCVSAGAVNLALRSSSIRLLGGPGALAAPVSDLTVCA
ncbi:cell wall-binding repeat-containing protein [uncultured Leifsonia sp.]|uniref:cell wall-binding repeat-containing protein n=1 Tax=uncultured Leifsonia sp. TaxID=340359 RepID=UPI0028D448BE|nr:cell wall-binding repeat-containing protein [uncultured Leifsonia sp.]